MWSLRRHDSAMDFPRQHTLDRAWTPPESDEMDSRHDYFNIYGTSPPRYPTATDRRWLKEAGHSPEQPSWVTDNFGFDSAIDLDTPSRPKPNSRLTEPLPYTPTRPCFVDASQPRAEGASRYPYTPDSSRILRRSTELPSSPIPWDEFSEDSASPVQNALSSCIAHFENLIQTRQPDEEQMEYIVGQFEAMAAHLSAPESQSKVTDEELFADADDRDLGVSGEGEEVENKNEEKNALEEEKLHHQAYVEEVGSYVAGIQKYILDLRMRMDEVKTLNSIQLDVINDLRKQMKTVRQSMREELERADERPDEDMDATLADLGALDTEEQNNRKKMKESWETLVEEEDLSREVHMAYSKLLRSTVDILTSEPQPPMSPKRRVVTIIRKPPQRSFWASFGEALDAVSNLLLEE
jgi:hypothetical protein